jgi:hypothetical protein
LVSDLCIEINLGSLVLFGALLTGGLNPPLGVTNRNGTTYATHFADIIGKHFRHGYHTIEKLVAAFVIDTQSTELLLHLKKDNLRDRLSVLRWALDIPINSLLYLIAELVNDREPSIPALEASAHTGLTGR